MTLQAYKKVVGLCLACLHVESFAEVVAQLQAANEPPNQNHKRIEQGLA